MKKPNVKKLSVAELTQLQKEIQAELESRESKLAAIEEVKKLALQKGLSVEDLMAELGGGAKKGKARGVVPPKYRNPKDASQTWTGRGKRPIWFQEAIDSGKSESSLLIK